MRERLNSPAPLLFAQFHLLGGSARFLLIAGGYTGLLLVALLWFRPTAPKDAPWSVVASTAVYVLAGIQCVVVCLGSISAVNKAMLRDHQSGMIQSHRLTPMSNLAVVIGYIFGSTLQITSIFLLNTLAGAILSIVAAVPVGTWLLGNGLMYCGMSTLWAMLVFLGVGPRKPSSSTAIIVGICLLANSILVFLPGAALMLSIPAVGGGAAMMFSSKAVPDAPLLLVCAASLVVTVFWILAGAARYRRPDLPALGALRGTVLLVIWLVFSILGALGYREVAATRGFEFLEDISEGTRWMATLIASMVVGIVPLAGSISCRAKLAGGAPARGPSDRIPGLFVALWVPALICGFLVVLGRPLWQDLIYRGDLAWHQAPTDWVVGRWCATGAALFLAMFTLRGLICAVIARSKAVKLVGLLVALGVFLAPPLVFDTDGYYRERTWQFGCSPIGTIIEAWSPEKVGVPTFDLTSGLAVQAVVAIGATLAGVMLSARGRPRKTNATG